LITHFHYDHCSNLELYPYAQVILHEKSHYLAHHPPGGGRSWAPAGFLEQLDDIASEGRLHLVSDEEVLPGIRTMWIGGHTPCDTCILVETAKGVVAIPGDTVMDYRTIEEDIPAGLHSNLQECIDAITKIKKHSDIVLPSHDPGVLDRWPGGIVG
jgi:glyoxylase-like metal-dependent hydrolase (beta-lactamase superfamily II)